MKLFLAGMISFASMTAIASQEKLPVILTSLKDRTLVIEVKDRMWKIVNGEYKGSPETMTLDFDNERLVFEETNRKGLYTTNGFIDLETYSSEGVMTSSCDAKFSIDTVSGEAFVSPHNCIDYLGFEDSKPNSLGEEVPVWISEYTIKNQKSTVRLQMPKNEKGIPVIAETSAKASMLDLVNGVLYEAKTKVLPVNLAFKMEVASPLAPTLYEQQSNMREVKFAVERVDLYGIHLCDVMSYSTELVPGEFLAGKISVEERAKCSKREFGAVTVDLRWVKLAKDVFSPGTIPSVLKKLKPKYQKRTELLNSYVEEMNSKK